MTTLTVPRSLLESLVDDDDCDLDHHGGCQAHMYLSLEPGEICPQRELKDLLERSSDDATECPEHVVTDPDELYELLDRDLRNVDSILMDLIGEDEDALFAHTTDWQAVADRLPKLLAECGAERKRFSIAADSVRWAVMLRRPDATGDVNDPDWVIAGTVMDNGRPRPVADWDEGAFQCVHVDEEWEL